MQQQQQQQQQGTMQQAKSGRSAKDEFNSPLFKVDDTPTASQLETLMGCGAFQTIEQGAAKLFAAMTIVQGDDVAPHHALYVLLTLAEQEGKFSTQRLNELTDNKSKQLIELTSQLMGHNKIKKMLIQVLAMVWHPRASPMPSPSPIPTRTYHPSLPSHSLLTHHTHPLPPSLPPACLQTQGRKHVYKTLRELCIEFFFDGVDMGDMSKVQKQYTNLFESRLYQQDEDAMFPISEALFRETEDGNRSFPSVELEECSKQFALRYEVYEDNGSTEDDTATQAPLCNAIAVSFVMLVCPRGRTLSP